MSIPIFAPFGTETEPDGCAALGGLDALRRAFRPALRRLLRHCLRRSARLRRVTVSVPAAAASAAGARTGVLQNRLHLPRPAAIVLAASPSSAAVA